MAFIKIKNLYYTLTEENIQTLESKIFPAVQTIFPNYPVLSLKSVPEGEIIQVVSLFKLMDLIFSSGIKQVVSEQNICLTILKYNQKIYGYFFDSDPFVKEINNFTNLHAINYNPKLVQLYNIVGKSTWELEKSKILPRMFNLEPVPEFGFLKSLLPNSNNNNKYEYSPLVKLIITEDLKILSIPICSQYKLLQNNCFDLELVNSLKFNLQKIDPKFSVSILWDSQQIEIKI